MQILTNGAPLPGDFAVWPKDGVEYSTVYVAEAAHWSDDDLPMSFAFGVAVGAVQRVQGSGGDGGGDDSPNGAATDVFLARSSEDPTASHVLGPGAVAVGHNVTLFVHVLDGLGATARATDVVRVSFNATTPSSGNGSAASAAAYFFATTAAALPDDGSGIASSPMLAPLVYGGISSVLHSLNTVDCSLVLDVPSSASGSGSVSVSLLPTGHDSCSSLRREPCRDTPHTCGECLPRHRGQAGNALSPCTSGNVTVQLGIDMECQGT